MTARRPHPGDAAALAVALLCLGPLVPLVARGDLSLGAADWAAIRFTVAQAAVSALLSGLLAIPVARALARRDFPGRGPLVTLMGAPFLLPSLIAVLGVLAVWGRSGWVSDGLAALGLPRLSPYGWGGVILAHVILNLPLATRLLLGGWLAIPAERFRLAASLGAPVGPLLERPMLRQVLPGTLAAIFALCLTSFSVALILGGGPRATTVELGIYQAIRFEADLGGAATLALVQYALSGAAALLAARLAAGPLLGGGLGRRVERWDSGGGAPRALDALAIGGAALLLLLPLLAVAVRGLAGLLDLPSGAGAAALRSLAVAGAAATLATGAALALALRGGAVAQAAGALPLAASSLVVGTGLLILLRPLVALDRAALPVTALVDGLLALPFALRALAPAVADAQARHGRLAEALGLRGWAGLRIAVLPAVRPALGLAAGLAAALSVGNLGVVVLFGGTAETLPLLMARLIGAYRTEAAAAVGLLAVALAFGLYAACDLWGRRARA